LILKGETHFFSGVAEGSIREEPMGREGFGYDPVFQPEGESRTFAQMAMSEKNAISHRGKALEQLSRYLNEVMQEGLK
jgi:XTP/dITP diphosphohydrolase